MADNQPNPVLPLLDADQIHMLIEAAADDSLALFKEILVLFEDESLNRLRELRTCMSSGNFDAMGRAAHALAGSSANVGAVQVWKTAKGVEDLCKGGNSAEAVVLLDRLESTYAQTLVELKAFVARLESEA